MKITKLFIAFAIALSIVACSRAETGSRRTETGSHEEVQLKVLKVFSAKQGKAVFRAYLVRWEEQEVVVEDSLAQTNYQEGDTMNVLVMNHPYPYGKKDYNLLSFIVLPQHDKKK